LTGLLLGLIACASVAAIPSAQTPLDVDELAQYRLADEVFARFTEASRLIAAVTREDPAFAQEPLFTRDVAVSGDAPVVAAAFESRLQSHPGLAGALRAAKLSARDYTKFALALVAAHLAHGFIKAGVLRGVPSGAAAANVAFVGAREGEIRELLAELGIDAALVSSK
jgi:hypothetical protein